MNTEAVDHTASDVNENEDSSASAEFDAAFDEFSGRYEQDHFDDDGASDDDGAGDDATFDSPSGTPDRQDDASRQADPLADAPEPLKKQFEQLQQANQQLLHRARSDAGRQSALQKRVQELESALQARQAQAAESKPFDLGGIPEELRDLYDEKELHGIMKIAEMVAARQTGTVKQELHKIKEDRVRAEESAAIAAERSYRAGIETALDEQAKGWRELDNNPAFLEWLNQADPMTGVPRESLMSAAYHNGKVDGVASFYKAYQNQRGAAASGAGAVNQSSDPKRDRLRRAIATPAAPVGRTIGPAEDDFDAAFDYRARQLERNGTR